MVASTLEWRRFHTSAVISAQGILLVGGDGSKNATEIVPIDGGRQSFPLATDRYFHCSIQVRLWIVCFQNPQSTIVDKNPKFLILYTIVDFHC